MRARRMNLVLRDRSYVINGLRIAWVALVLWFELGVFKWSIHGCSWPDAVWKEVSSPPSDRAILLFPSPNVPNMIPTEIKGKWRICGASFSDSGHTGPQFSLAAVR